MSRDELADYINQPLCWSAAYVIAGAVGDFSSKCEPFMLVGEPDEAVAVEIDLAAYSESSLIAQDTTGNFWAGLIGTSTSWFSVNPADVSELAQKAQGRAAIEDIRARCGDTKSPILVAVTSEGIMYNDLSEADWRAI